MIRNNILLVAVTLLGASMVFKCDNDKLYKIIADLQGQLKAKDDRINASSPMRLLIRLFNINPSA